MAVYGTVQLGSSGEDVRRLQESLNANGANLNVDGNFGADTQKAVQNYQQQHGMTANGVVGANTWSLLTGTPKNGNIQVEAPVATDWGGISGVSDQTRQNLTRYENGYTPSANVQSALARLETAQGNRPGPFSSSYQQQLDDLYNQIAGRQPFEYDLNGDMLYQQYRDQYARMGQQAMRDTMGQAAAMTGGYGNSYAQLAGQQAYGSYLQELNDRIPELYDRAYGRYADEGNRLAQQYALASDRYADEYGKYRDQYADWMNEYQLAQNAYDTERNFDYNDYGNMLIAETREAALSEIDKIRMKSQGELDRQEINEQTVTACEEISKTLNPTYAKEKERDAAISSLGGRLDSLESGMAEILEYIKNNKK